MKHLLNYDHNVHCLG